LWNNCDPALVNTIASVLCDTSKQAVHFSQPSTEVSLVVQLLTSFLLAALSGATCVFLSTQRADWLSGRYISANWDMEELETDFKEKVLKEGYLLTTVLGSTVNISD